MAIQSVNLNFTNTFKGELIGPKGRVDVGSEKGTLAPYDMLYGALASCLYATFLGIAEKNVLDSSQLNLKCLERRGRKFLQFLSGLK